MAERSDAVGLWQETGSEVVPEGQDAAVSGTK